MKKSYLLLCCLFFVCYLSPICHLKKLPIFFTSTFYFELSSFIFLSYWGLSGSRWGLTFFHHSELPWSFLCPNHHSIHCLFHRPTAFSSHTSDWNVLLLSWLMGLCSIKMILLLDFFILTSDLQVIYHKSYSWKQTVNISFITVLLKYSTLSFFCRIPFIKYNCELCIVLPRKVAQKETCLQHKMLLLCGFLRVLVATPSRLCHYSLPVFIKTFWVFRPECTFWMNSQSCKYLRTFLGLFLQSCLQSVSEILH